MYEETIDKLLKLIQKETNNYSPNNSILFPKLIGATSNLLEFILKILKKMNKEESF